MFIATWKKTREKLMWNSMGILFLLFIFECPFQSSLFKHEVTSIKMLELCGYTLSPIAKTFSNIASYGSHTTTTSSPSLSHTHTLVCPINIFILLQFRKFTRLLHVIVGVKQGCSFSLALFGLK